LEAVTGLVMVAESKLIWLATGSLSNLWRITTCHNTCRFKPLPGCTWIATTTSKLTRCVRHSVPRRENGGSIATGNAVPVIESFRGAESPTCSTVTLVANAPNDRSALRPLFPCVKTRREIASQWKSGFGKTNIFQNCSIMTWFVSLNGTLLGQGSCHQAGEWERHHFNPM